MVLCKKDCFVIKVFFIEPTGFSLLYLRRYSEGNCPLRPGKYSLHDAKTAIGQGPKNVTSGDSYSHNDSRWPSHCGCGYAFQEHDTWQLFAPAEYRRLDTGETMSIQTAPVGACWNASWFVDRKVGSFKAGSDGRCLVVKTPGGEWVIDSRALNCTIPQDDVHCCWVRHGRPEDSTLHVDKNGYTCAAGAGSIVCGSYHGFLHQGHLTNC